MKFRQLGDLRLRRVVESIWTADVSFLFEETSREFWEPHLGWLAPHGFDVKNWKLRMPMQSYIVQTPHHNILIDTCVGGDKHLPHYPEWHQNPHRRYVDNLNAHGLSFEDIDYVMCTHLHTDHSGWNTRLVDGRWVPTFPNAKYIFSKKEYEHWEKVSNGVFLQNVLPVMEAGKAELVVNDFALDDHVWFEPTPGHTPDHVCVNVRSGDEQAVITGDLMHSPIQCLHPEWHSGPDVDKEMASRVRRDFMERHCEANALICTIHFPLPSAGYFRRHGPAFRFEYDRNDW